MYAIVVFPDENVYEGVPRSWIKVTDEGTFCCWPRCSTKVTAMIKHQCPPTSTWDVIRCNVKAYVDTYKEMINRRKMEAEKMTTDDQAEKSDDLSSDESTFVRRAGIVLPSSSDSEGEENLPTPPEKSNKERKKCK